MSNMPPADIKRLVDLVARVQYWEEMLGFTLTQLGTDWENVDEFVKEHYAENLKEPEVMARILGSKQKE